MICYESGPYCGLCYNYDIRQVQQCDLDQFPLILMHGKHNTGRKLRIRKKKSRVNKELFCNVLIKIHGGYEVAFEEKTKSRVNKELFCNVLIKIHEGYEVAFEEILDSRTSNWILPEEFNLIQVFFSHHVVYGWCNRKKLES